MEGLRSFANSTILDIFYALSPHYAPLIYKEIRDQLSKAYLDYKREHPNFKGKVSILGHSLGSFIVYDILTLQKQRKQTKSKYDSVTYEELKLKKEQALAEKDEQLKEEVKIKFKQLDADKRNVRFWKRMVYQGAQKSSVRDLLKGLEINNSILPKDFASKLQLEFEVDNFFLIGSPVSMFLTVRGDMESEISFPSCKNIYNIMHPYDPVVKV